MSVLVFLENWDGKFKKLSFELVSYASKVAEMSGAQAVAVSIGNVEDSELTKLATYGASKIISIENALLKSLDDQAYTSLIAEVAKKINADVLVLSNNNTGKAIAPRLSVRLKAGIASGVSKLPVSTSPFVV
ncbi:MAG: electron transfer flavoprotein subunit alpha, partial [Bacteroidetes bacterium HGW-Bacteroidetes-9]